MGRQIETCFISAPAGAKLDVLRASLLARHIRVVVPDGLDAGPDLQTEIQHNLLQVDLVIGVLTTERRSQWVLFEIGQAWALRKQIVLIAPPTMAIPSSLRGVLVLRVNLRNRDAIDFALDQLLAAPERAQHRAVSRPVGASLGDKTDDLIDELNSALATTDGARIEALVAKAIRQSGIEIVVRGRATDQADLAIWSDFLASLVGNPLLVEIKAHIKGAEEARKALTQLSAAMQQSATSWGLLLFGNGPSLGHKAWTGCPPNILVRSLRDLFEEMRFHSFEEIVRDMRNYRVHGEP